jgi:hypothetical protein
MNKTQLFYTINVTYHPLLKIAGIFISNEVNFSDWQN